MVTEYEVYGALATQRARINFLKWHTSVVPYIKGIREAKSARWRMFKELFLTFLLRREVGMNHYSGKVAYIEKVSREEYLEIRQGLKEEILENFRYVRWAKKKIREYENEKIYKDV